MWNGKKRNDQKLKTAQEFVNVEDIDDGILYAQDGHLFGYLQVRAGDNHLLNEDEIVTRAANLAHAVSSDRAPLQILAVPRTIDTAGMLDMLNERRKLTRHDAKLKLLNGEIISLQEMAREGTKEPMIVIKCWVEAVKGADVILKKRLQELKSRLSEFSVPADVMGDMEITYLCKMFADLSEIHTHGEAIYEDIPMLEGKRRLLTRKNNHMDDATALRNLITPIGGLAFRVSTLCVGPVKGRIYGAMKYPSELDYGWAVDLVNCSDCVTAITYYPGSAYELGEALSKSIKRSATDAETSSDVRRRKKFERQAMDADQLIDELDYKNAAIGHVSILAMPFTSDEDKLEEVCRLVCSRYARKRIKLKPLGNIQQESYMGLSPYHIPPQIIGDITQQIMPLESLMGGSPLTVNVYRDDRGSYFARTTDGSVISMDLQYRGGDRTNGNMVITGEAGQGKSTALKHIILSQYMAGLKILIIDPEREYRDLCQNLGGTWLDVGGGAAKINPLQIRPVPEDDVENGDNGVLYSAEDNSMALHIHTLEVFFSLYLPQMSDVLKALLKKELVALYEDFKITWDADVSAMTADQFPIMTDLYKRLEAKKQSDPRLEELALLVYDMAYGATSFLWNGYTNVDMSNNFIVLDTNKLSNTADNIKRAQYFNNLSMCWEIMCADRTEPVMLVCDEAHIVLDPAITQTAMFLRNIAKRARKYEGSLFTVFQSVSDALFPEIRLYGQAILDNATYKLVFGCDGKNLQDTAEIFRLTNQERNILLARVKKQALMFMGRQHIHVEFDIPQYKLSLMGEGGGR